MRVSILFIFYLFLGLNKSNGQIQRQDAVNSLNFIDSLTKPMQVTGTNLANYIQKLVRITTEENDYKLPYSHIDTLKNYYNNLLESYDLALLKTREYTLINKFDSLKNNLIALLEEGRNVWSIIVPIKIKMYSFGLSSLNVGELRIFANADSIYKDSEKKLALLIWVIAKQESEIENEYHLEFVNNLYQ